MRLLRIILNWGRCPISANLIAFRPKSPVSRNRCHFWPSFNQKVWERQQRGSYAGKDSECGG